MPAARAGETIQTAFQPEQQSVITLPWRIDGLLINQQGIENAADFDQLLPLPTVARKSRYLAGGNCSNFSKHTSATMRSKPMRVTVPEAERPRSSSITSS